MAEQRRVRRLQVFVLLLTVAALGVIVLRITGLAAGPLPVREPVAVVDSPSSSPPTATAPTPLPTEAPLETFPLPTADPFAPTTPADQWANRVLDQTLPDLVDPLPPATGFVWWQSSAASGELAVGGGGVTLAGEMLNLDGLRAVSILVPERANPNHLAPRAEVRWEGAALILTTVPIQPGAAEAYWLLSNADAALAVAALVNQARARDFTLVAAYAELFAGEAQLVLTGALAEGAAAASPPQARAATPTPTGRFTPSPTLPPTPTRVPEAFMGQVIAAALDLVIDEAKAFDPAAVARFAENHPWTGLLTWTETGPAVGGLPIAVQEAQELTFYTLEPRGTAQDVSRFLHVTYDGNVTRLPAQRVLFQEHRMDEVVFWMVRRSIERGGQLLVAYDDFGTRQAITVIGFRPLSEPQP